LKVKEEMGWFITRELRDISIVVKVYEIVTVVQEGS